MEKSINGGAIGSEATNDHVSETESRNIHEHSARRRITGLVWGALVVSVMTPTFLFALDNTIVANIRPAIIREFGHVEDLVWITVAYALGETSLNPFWAKLYGRYDNKVLFILSVLVFNIGSALCGAAPSMAVLIIGRVIGGCGGTGIYIGSLNIFSALTMEQERALYLGLAGIAWCLGTVLGPIVGGAIADSSATWRWAFYINLCLTGVTAPVYLWFLPWNPSSLAKTSTKRLRSIDFTGIILFIGATSSLVIAISLGGQTFPWSDRRIIALLALTIVLWILFALQQALSILTTEADRVFPIHLCKEKEMCLLFVESAIGISCIGIPIYFLPLFFQFVRGDDALSSGVKMLPLIFGVIAGVLFSGSLFEKLSLYMAWYLAGSALSLIGAGLFMTMSPDLSDAKVYGFSVIISVGAGLYAQLGLTVAQILQPPARHPEVTALLSFAQQIGMSLSLGIGTSIFSNRATSGVRAALVGQQQQGTGGIDESQIAQTITGTGSQLLSTLDLQVKREVLAAITAAIGDVFILLSVSAAIAVIGSVFMKRQRALVGTAGEQET